MLHPFAENRYCHKSKRQHHLLKVSKFQKQNFQPKLLSKNKPTNLFFYPDYLPGQKNKFDGSLFARSFGWKICFRFLLTFRARPFFIQSVCFRKPKVKKESRGERDAQWRRQVALVSSGRLRSCQSTVLCVRVCIQVSCNLL